MNTKWKVILSILLLITAICSVFALLLQRQLDENTAEIIAGKQERAVLLAETILAEVSSQYRKRIVSFSNPDFSPSRERMIRAFAQGDRSTLLRLSMLLVKALQKENPYFATVGWILPDNRVFLRPHKPEKYGDGVGHLRVDIAAVNEGRQQRSGFDIGTSSMQYRVAQPVYYQGEYLGVVQFGIHADIILDAIRDKLKTVAGMVVVNEEMDSIKGKHPSGWLRGKTHTLVPGDSSMPDVPVELLDWQRDHQRVMLQGRPHVILNVLPLMNSQNDNLGHFFVALDISREVAQKRKLISVVLLVSAFLLLGSFLILYYSYGALVERIVNLNRTLEQNNLELENRVHERTLKLQESEQRLQKILDKAPIGILIAEAKTMRFKYANPDICTMLGYTREELEQMDISEIHSPGDFKRVVQEFKEQEEGKKILTSDISFLRKNGTEFEADVISTPLELGGQACVTGFIVDQTTTRKMAIELHRAQKMEAIGLMAGGVAHDLNNILSGIVNYPEILLLKLPEESELREPIAAIRASGLRAAAVVSDLLTVARGAASTRAPHDVNRLIREYLDSPEARKLRALHPQLVCREHLEAEHAVISCSPIHIKKTIMNLLTNAAEAVTGTGAVDIFTTNHCVEDGGELAAELDLGEYLRVEVRDNGLGIDSRDLEHIFEPFYTKKKMGRSGTGLGLSVVWNTVQDHDGQITVHSDEQGTSFQLYFPVCGDNEEGMPQTSEDDLPLGHGEKILVIDDEPQLRDIASQILVSLGYRVDSVCSGELALEFLVDTEVDLLIIDMLMEPGMNGREAYRKILELHPGQKAVIASGFSESDEVKGALELGAGGFIKKPYSMEDLARAVRDALAG